jgi:hypothetical protein
MQTSENQLTEITLTEDTIKKAFVPFLRNFYKDRYAIQYGSVAATFDNVSESGLIADGKLTFIKHNSEDATKTETFICTYEATSLDKLQEVKFGINQSYFLWDCAAFTALVTATFYILSFATRITFLYFLGTIGNIGFLIGFALIAFSTWFFTMRSWKKYRYIYAIEQFKRYFADEQWIVLGDDIFHHSLDPNFVELKNQCTYNGFGLAIVNKYGESHAVITPSRLGIYGKDRKITDWVTDLNFYKNTASKAAAVAQYRDKVPDVFTVFWNKLWQPIGYHIIRPIKEFFWNFFGGSLQKTTSTYSQFTGSFRTQKYLTLLSFLVLGFFLRKILAEEMSKNLTEEEYWQYLEHRMGRDNPEDEPGYIIDDKPVHYNGIQKQYPDMIEKETDDGVQVVDLSGGDNQDETTESNNTETVQTMDEPVTDNLDNWVTVAANQAEKPAIYSKNTKKDYCTLVSKGKGWLIQDSFFKTFKLAEARLEALKHRGIECFAVSKSCIYKNELGYLIFIGTPILKEKDALTEKTNYQKALKRYGLVKETLLLRKIVQ